MAERAICTEPITDTEDNMSLRENMDRPVLSQVQWPGGIITDCHATGRRCYLGHPLAECPDPGCPGEFCPTCGQWLCADCQLARDRVQELLLEATNIVFPAAEGSGD
jgi:hypothetical protein